MMEKYHCKNFIFSSTAAVYGDKDNCCETDMKNPTTPYGESKTAVEMLLHSLAKLHKDWRVISLRYFNPCGAHKSGLIGDEPYVYPNNLFPFIQEVIAGKREKLSIFGNDYPTPDGTCVRDYIHITDLAQGHVFALNRLEEMKENYDVVNLGSGKGYSVYEIVKGYEEALGKPINWCYAPRRIGDVPKLVANPTKANTEWGWKTELNLKQMCEDSVNFVNKRLLKKE
jgi:UDP-glucose 4-epimerase